MRICWLGRKCCANRSRKGKPGTIPSQEERIDKATALREWLYAGAEEYLLGQLSAGRLTLSHAAELLEMSLYDLQRLAGERGIEIGATEEQYRKARQTARHLGQKEFRQG